MPFCSASNWEGSILVDKNPRVTAILIFTITLGNAAQVGITNFTYQ